MRQNYRIFHFYKKCVSSLSPLKASILTFISNDSNFLQLTSPIYILPSPLSLNWFTTHERRGGMNNSFQLYPEVILEIPFCILREIKYFFEHLYLKVHYSCLMTIRSVFDLVGSIRLQTDCCSCRIHIESPSLSLSFPEILNTKVFALCCRHICIFPIFTFSLIFYIVLNVDLINY